MRLLDNAAEAITRLLCARPVKFQRPVEQHDVGRERPQFSALPESLCKLAAEIGDMRSLKAPTAPDAVWLGLEGCTESATIVTDLQSDLGSIDEELNLNDTGT